MVVLEPLWARSRGLRDVAVRSLTLGRVDEAVGEGEVPSRASSCCAMSRMSNGSPTVRPCALDDEDAASNASNGLNVKPPASALAEAGSEVLYGVDEPDEAAEVDEPLAPAVEKLRRRCDVRDVGVRLLMGRGEVAEFGEVSAVGVLGLAPSEGAKRRVEGGRGTGGERGGERTVSAMAVCEQVGQRFSPL